MEAAASSLSTLLSTLRVNGPWTPPGTWESVIPESGAARVSHLGGRPRLQPIYELASVTDDALIHLALHALYGVKTSLDEIEELSALSSSNPADRTSNRVPNVWLRSSSTTSMGSILKSFRSTGLAVFFLCKFVHFYLFQSREMNCASREVHEHEDSGDKDTKQHQPYTLVNQAFAAAVNKVLEGYFCSLNTLLASIRLRRSVGQSGIASKISNGMSCDPTSEVTLLEVYLHTEELRRHVKSLGNICFPKFAGLTLCQEGLNTDANVEFENFPRGTDLLSYLYVHIRDADPVHYGLLKYLFIRSCEPYFNFIKSWIYRASVDDPYEEFLITQTENKGAQGISSDITDDFILFPLKGRNHVSAPCFLKEICHPLLRTGQQLQVLMNLLKYCNLAATEGDVYPSRNIIHMEGVLPWFDTPIESSMNSFTFSKSAIEALTCKRDAMYKLMMEKLQHFFSNVEVIAFDTASNFLHKRTDLVDASVSDAELFYGDSDAVLPCNMAADEKDDSSSNSQESSDKEDPLESSECSSYTSMDDTEVESSTACENLSSSMFSLYCTSTGEAKGSLVTSKLLSSQSSSVDHGINCAIPIECEKDDRLSCKHVLVHPQNTKHTAVPDGSELDYQYSQFSPFDRFMKRASCSFESMNSVGEFLYSDHKRSVGNAVYPLHSESGSTKLSNSKNYEKFVTINQPWNTSIPYNLSLNPILKNAACYHTESDMQQKSKNQSLASFDFESVMDPCEVYCARSPSLLVESVNGAATAGQPSTQPYEQPDCSTKLLQAQTRSQSSLTSSGEMSTGDSLQKNASGGAFWEISLLYNDKSKEKPAMDFSSQFDMPLDIVIDKCIIQEILLQYKYVSSFTMKLLEEGFDLCAHLLALRRYHFMEIADWADSFIASIYQKKWSFVKSEQKRSEIQGLMDLALQRSSCDSDPYKERLFIYMRESPVDSVDASPCGLDLLDDILLGYKAEWPMNIVITVDALKIYAEIFCYLLQVRFAVFSLTEVWRFLKELTQFIGRSSHSRSDVLKKLNFVMKLRHKLYHFLSTLQQYLHCHLSDISWRRFQHSLKNQVRDILDLEYVHICYITDALDICFLSDESKQVATIIKSMLQLALELRSCFQSGDTCDLSVNQLSNLQYLINFSWM
ncbi:Spc97 / Spc98 family of spindle pole body (SBP) component [Zea mays]|uniref:Spc97 / Spc98 family of spindle pole body (SBP) component n=1 Tax=Zea mays TaxID=4577 RepID=A0A1D6E2Q1_MAIZE|nr:Spc97 / Spc98 family of spindle pole body (SBP) component [Zea mays]